ncbi:TRAP transporter small permease [Alkalihalobacillus oceani]|uniref:TRAP transporter small permease n=1 Tax=Halalkalibacter oceani TaxID=1653776 RepID=UPI00203C8C56|nr:TRAP transporter small permease [Halalkalibacter oceani]MCM3762146.1 TRAP transporter small permease [Halalkalibacter oceani]
MQVISNIRDHLEKTIEVFSVLFFCIGIISTVFGTFARTFTFLPAIPWSAELTRFSIIASVFLVIGIGVRKGMHVSFTLLLEKLSPRFRLGLQMVNNTLMIIFFSFIGFYGYEMAVSNSSQFSAILQLPMVYPYLFIPLGSLLLILEVIFLTIIQTSDYRKQEVKE